MKDKVRLTKEQAVIITAYTGILAGEVLSELYKYSEEVFGRPVLSHEFGDKDFMANLRKASQDDFLAICFLRGENE